MPDSQRDIKEIRKNIAIGLTNQLLPFTLIGLLGSWLERTPGISELAAILSVLALALFAYGYGLSASAIDKYAAYKGYKNTFLVYSILNIFGLFVLYLLKEKSLVKDDCVNKDPIEKFSILAIFASYLVIPFFLGMIASIPGIIIMGEGFADYLKNDRDFSLLLSFVAKILWAWYFFKEFKETGLTKKVIFGSGRKLIWKLPIGLAVIKYFFNGGINSITLYSLSFFAPTYVENQVNQEYATSLSGWIFFAVSALIYAPIMEELFFRGIIFQKLAIKKSIATGLFISAILFAAIHFRFDFIPLCLSGVITAIFYFKTKQLATSIIFHFTYNLMVVLKRLYDWLFPDPTLPAQATIPELQQYFVDNLGIYALYLAITVPYFIYFVCKNFPRNREIDKLPYFVNQ